MNTTKIKLVAGIVALFVLGISIGVLGNRISTEREFRKLAQFDPEKRKAYILQKYTKELHLTETQQAGIGKIIDEKIDAIAQYTQRYKEEIDTIRQRHDERIKALLSPEQQQLFDEMKQRMRKRWEKDEKK